MLSRRSFLPRAHTPRSHDHASVDVSLPPPQIRRLSRCRPLRRQSRFFSILLRQHMASLRCLRFALFFERYVAVFDVATARRALHIEHRSPMPSDGAHAACEPNDAIRRASSTMLISPLISPSRLNVVRCRFAGAYILMLYDATSSAPSLPPAIAPSLHVNRYTAERGCHSRIRF